LLILSINANVTFLITHFMYNFNTLQGKIKTKGLISMKKFFTFPLLLALIFSFVSCGEKTPSDDVPSGNQTLGTTLLGVFRENADKSPEEIANACLSSPSIEFMGSVMPVEKGALTGLDSEIGGFSEGYMFAPNIGTIPFIGYVFEAGENSASLAEKLKANANPRWNICTEAEETIIEEKNGKVFFLMCPKSLDSGEGGNISPDENIAP